MNTLFNTYAWPYLEIALWKIFDIALGAAHRLAPTADARARYRYAAQTLRAEIEAERSARGV